MAVDRINLPEDLLKILRGEHVDPPEGKSVDEYEKQLVEDHLEERENFFKSKSQPEIDAKINEAIKNQYPKIVEPMRKKLKEMGLEEHQLAELNHKQLMELAIDTEKKRYEELMSKYEELEKGSTGKKSEFTEKYKKLQETVTEKNIEITKLNETIAILQEECTSKVADAERMAIEKIHEAEKDQALLALMNEISDDLMISGWGGIMLIKQGMQKYNRKFAIVNNQLLAKDLEGADAMDLDKRKIINTPDDLKELVLDICAKENWIKKNNLQHADGVMMNGSHHYENPGW